jgi:hypothetical protein
MRKCARCGLLSPDQSIRCECGFDFRVDDRRAVVGEHAQWRSAARWTFVGGLLLIILGVGITVATYAQADQNAGRYTIYCGLVVAGVVMCARGLNRLKAIRDVERGD